MEESEPKPSEVPKEVPSQEAAPVSPEGEEKTSPNESEYDSAGSYTDEEQDRVRSRSQNHSGSESEGSVVLERESGDGQESVPAKKVDDDEDKKNPQYIPKRGTFYEHDDRTVDDVDEIKEEEEKEKDPKKKVWKDKKEKWTHDRFNDLEQTPKSRTEIIQVYGYDIRNEDGPPRARRRRRYGRGPNKYTRKWEDEDAYSKPPPPRTKKPVRNSRNTEEFPPLSTTNSSDNREYQTTADNNEPETNGNVKTVVSAEISKTASSSQEFSRSQQQGKVGSGRVVKPNKEIKDSDYKGFTMKSRQGRNVKTEQKIVAKPSKKNDFIQSQNFTNKNNVQELENDMAKLNVQDNRGGKQRQGSVPPRLQSEQKGSKRYSSMRQRSLPESATPPFAQQPPNYYPNEYNQGGQPAIIHQNTQIHPATTQVPQIAPPPLPPIPQVPVTATPILQAPQFAAPFPQAPPPFLAAGVAPPTFIPQQTPQIINYVPSQAQFPQGYQSYQQQFNSVNQPPELYQPATGITYYSTDQQVTQQRCAPLKRPKAAIPIIAPPPIDMKARVREEDTSSYDSESTEQTMSENSSFLESDVQQ